jgi:tetratricopeptide (TPR) repeat protein
MEDLYVLSWTQPGYRTNLFNLIKTSWRLSGKVLLNAVVVCICVQSAWAQPSLQNSSPVQTPAQQVETKQLLQEWDALRRTVGDGEILDPGNAIDRYQAFYEERGYRQAPVAITISLAIARLYWHELGDTTKAEEIYDWTIKHYGAYGNELQLVRKERSILLEKRQGLRKTPDRVHVAIPNLSSPAIGVPNKISDDVTPNTLPSFVKITPPTGTGFPLRPINQRNANPFGTTSATASASALPDQVTSAPNDGFSSLSTVKVLGSQSLGAVTPEAFRASALPTPISSKTVGRAAVLEQMMAGLTKTEDAYKQGLFSVEDAVKLLGRADEWGRIEGHEETSIRRSLAELIVKHDAQRLKNLTTLSPKVRLWTGDYLQSIGDARAVPMLESVIAEIKTPVKSYEPSALLFLSIEKLAWFYEHKGDYIKSADTWLRLKPLLHEPGWMVPDALVAAARQYAQMGDLPKAKELYAQVPQYGNEYFTQLALIRQVKHLADAGQLDEAVKFSAPILESVKPSYLKVRILTDLGSAFYAKSNFERVRYYSTKAISEAKTLDAKETKGLEALAQANLQWAQQWEKAPIKYDTITRKVAREEQVTSQSYVIRSLLASYKGVPMVASCNQPDIQVDVSQSGGINQYATYKQLIVSIPNKLLEKKLDVMIVVTSPEFPGFQLAVPLHIDAETVAIK